MRLFVLAKIYLEVDHVPESLQICARCFLLSSLELTVVDEANKLLEPLPHEEMSLTYSGPHLAPH